MPVIFSRACEYALRALVEMARHPEKRCWKIQDLAARTKSPAPFLAKTFQTLVRQKFLTSTKGRGGGFSFSRPLNEITLIEVVYAIDGPALATDCALGLPECNDKDPCPFHEEWGPIRDKIIQGLSTQTLEDFAKR